MKESGHYYYYRRRCIPFRPLPTTTTFLLLLLLLLVVVEPLFWSYLNTTRPDIVCKRGLAGPDRLDA